MSKVKILEKKERNLRKDKNTTVSTNQTQKTKQQKVKEKHRVEYTRAYEEMNISEHRKRAGKQTKTRSGM